MSHRSRAPRPAPRALALVILVIVVCAPGAAQTQERAEETRRQDLERIDRRIAELKAQLATSEKKAATLEEELRRLDLELEIASQERAAIAERRAQIEERLARLDAELARVRAEREELSRAMGARVLLLARLGRYGYLRLLARARTASQLFESLASLDAMVRRDARLLSRFRQVARRLAGDLELEQKLRQETEGLFARGRQEEMRVARLHADRQRLLGRIREEASRGRREVSALLDKAERLERLLDVLSRGQSPEVAGGGVRPWKGVLDWPVKGRLLLTFGRQRHPKFNTWTVNKGIAVATPAGTPVHAVFGGVVIFARFFPAYGNLAVVDHGDGVLTLYAHLQSIAVKVGGFVATGDIIGLVGTGPESEEPSLYFEVRDRQQASDPVAWLR